MKVRRVIVATNIAETSITIPGVAYVIDSGYKKAKEYVYRTSGGDFFFFSSFEPLFHNSPDA